MNEERYWSIIEDSLGLVVSPQTVIKDSLGLAVSPQTEYLVQKVSRMPLVELNSFDKWTHPFEELIVETRKCLNVLDELGYCLSDDGHLYFSRWVISQGKEKYYQILRHPEVLEQLVGRSTSEFDYPSDECFGNVAAWARELKSTGKIAN